MSMYKQKRKLKVTEEISEKIVSLPTHPNLKENDINFIIKSINDFHK